jgi:hypothetical protein
VCSRIQRHEQSASLTYGHQDTNGVNRIPSAKSASVVSRRGRRRWRPAEIFSAHRAAICSIILLGDPRWCGDLIYSASYFFNDYALIVCAKVKGERIMEWATRERRSITRPRPAQKERETEKIKSQMSYVYSATNTFNQPHYFESDVKNLLLPLNFKTHPLNIYVSDICLRRVHTHS